MENLVSSFYSSGSGGDSASTFLDAPVTEVLIGTDVAAPPEGVTSLEIITEHSPNRVYLNGIRMREGADNDYILDRENSKITFVVGWTFYSGDLISITI